MFFKNLKKIYIYFSVCGMHATVCGVGAGSLLSLCVLGIELRTLGSVARTSSVYLFE